MCVWLLIIMFLSPQIQIKYFFTNYLLINLSTQKLHLFCSDKVVPINLFLYLRYKVLYSRYRDLFQTPLLRKHDCAEAFCPHFRFKQETLAESPNPGRQYLHLEHKIKVGTSKKEDGACSKIFHTGNGNQRSTCICICILRGTRHHICTTNNEQRNNCPLKMIITRIFSCFRLLNGPSWSSRVLVLGKYAPTVQ